MTDDTEELYLYSFDICIQYVPQQVLGKMDIYLYREKAEEKVLIFQM